MPHVDVASTDIGNKSRFEAAEAGKKSASDAQEIRGIDQRGSRLRCEHDGRARGVANGTKFCKPGCKKTTSASSTEAVAIPATERLTALDSMHGVDSGNAPSPIHMVRWPDFLRTWAFPSGSRSPNTVVIPAVPAMAAAVAWARRERYTNWARNHCAL